MVVASVRTMEKFLGYRKISARVRSEAQNMAHGLDDRPMAQYELIEFAVHSHCLSPSFEMINRWQLSRSPAGTAVLS